ncbi:MAG TPA: hypothetical protein VIL56_07240 [Gaiellaceae bacterium]|jgi:hypothetical protein
MRKRRRSYAWALHARHSPNRARLTDSAESGLRLATALADDARYRSQLALRHEPLPPTLTLEELAEREQITLAAAETRIGRARRELFGKLSDSGIYYRLKQERARKARALRVCEHCGRPLPRTSTAARKYCPGSRCRVNAHRARQREATTA